MLIGTNERELASNQAMLIEIIRQNRDGSNVLSSKLVEHPVGGRIQALQVFLGSTSHLHERIDEGTKKMR